MFLLSKNVFIIRSPRQRFHGRYYFSLTVKKARPPIDKIVRSLLTRHRSSLLHLIREVARLKQRFAINLWNEKLYYRLDDTIIYLSHSDTIIGKNLRYAEQIAKQYLISNNCIDYLTKFHRFIE
ncbi:hypothetical protein V1477_005825 [Vespula maculifrons]|uniref:Uncharacterized protein n=1 Tax=Vespula maculifrons TaxID=7453 RepID=A0ABD2CLC2_VESMC